MNILYVILAHERPEQVMELAATLTAPGTGGSVRIHFDTGAHAQDFATLRREAELHPNVALVKQRVRTGWGRFGLVESVVNALSEAQADGETPDYVVLLSGADLPVQPLDTLRRFLRGARGREFIEVYDQSWIVDGLRASRYRYHFVFDPKKHPKLEHASLVAQRALGLKRRFPKDLTPRFGSQWWALSWPTCEAILAYIRANPKAYRYFRTVWIPDEIFFQTLVHRLVAPDAIAGHSLTHYQFSDKGKPLVFHDDHADYALGLDKFFVRKCDPRAERLRARCLARAHEADHGIQPEPARSRASDYRIKVKAQTQTPRPGQIFYRDQYLDNQAGMADALERDLVVLFGPKAIVDGLAAALDGPPFQVLGEVFADRCVDFWREAESLHGLRRGDHAIRDLHPMLYLNRLLDRCDGVPVVTWTPQANGRVLPALACNPNVTVVACLPRLGEPEREEAALWAAGLEDGLLAEAARGLPGSVGRARLARARRDYLAAHRGLGRFIPDALTQRARVDAGGAAQTGAAALQPLLHLPWSLKTAEADPVGGLRQPDPEAHARTFDTAWRLVPGCGRPWFPDLVTRLRQSAAERLWSVTGPEALTPDAAGRISQYVGALDGHGRGHDRLDPEARSADARATPAGLESPREGLG